MRVSHWRYSPGGDWRQGASAATAEGHLPGAQLLLVFGSGAALDDSAALGEIAARHPAALVVGCSTAGEISGTQVADGTLVATAVELASSTVHAAYRDLPSAEASGAVGEALGRDLAAIPDLAYVLVLSEGIQVNGSALVAGLGRSLPPNVVVTGGLAGDGPRFARTRVIDRGAFREHGVVAVGIAGRRLRVGCGSLGGWDPFGPERLITRASANELYELDGHSALELYKRYLGADAAGLPATGLYFPLAVRAHRDETAVVRTILQVDEAEQSILFAGEMPEGGLARFMKANFERLIDGATDAAHICHTALGEAPASLALLVSCVGRRMVLDQRVEEELEAVRAVLGPTPVLTGFYSYGEISPFTPTARCELHNQTMTITSLAES
ncbi:MAG: FIST C-terminal domain-containing protein [Holophagales bacterium]|nr:MAG: FIST C-terminal domain-containing protein [Holophagales bacterium]